MGDGYSIAWRVLDAQYWGVPQRRKRIYLVADLNGDSAGKVLFDSEGVSGHSAKMQAARKDFARCAQGSAGEAGWGKEVLNDQGGSSISVENDLSPTLRAEAHQHLPIVVPTSLGDLYSMSKSYHFAHATPDQADALVATDY